MKTNCIDITDNWTNNGTFAKALLLYFNKAYYPPFIPEAEPQLRSVENNGQAEGLKKLEVFPNPTDANFTVRLPYLVEKATLHLTNIEGRVVFSQEINTQEVVLQRNALPSGIYFIQVTQGKDLFHAKVILK